MGANEKFSRGYYLPPPPPYQNSKLHREWKGGENTFVFDNGKGLCLGYPIHRTPLLLRVQLYRIGNIWVEGGNGWGRDGSAARG